MSIMKTNENKDSHHARQKHVQMVHYVAFDNLNLELPKQDDPCNVASPGVKSQADADMNVINPTFHNIASCFVSSLRCLSRNLI